MVSSKKYFFYLAFVVFNFLHGQKPSQVNFFSSRLPKKHKSSLFYFSGLVFLIVLLDQLTKYLVLKSQLQINFKIFTLHLVKNTGAGFGLLKNQTLLLTIISILVTLFVIYYYKKIPKQPFPQIFTALFLAGVIGNLIDRLFRKFVIDFIDFHFWPAFNLADACITISAIGLIIYFWKK